MNDQELDRLIAQANPFGTDTVRQLPVAGAESDLLEDILTTTTTAAAAVEQPRRPRRRRGLLVAAAAAVIAAGVGIGGALFPDGNPAAPPSAYAAEVVAVAEANPRLLLDKPGWKVVKIGQFSKETGEMQLSDGKQSLSVHWRPGNLYQQYLDDRSHGNAKQPIELLGQQGTLFLYSGSKSDYATILPAKGVNFLEIRGNVGSEPAYRDLLAALKPVDVNTWLDALPESVVKPADTAKVVTEMLADIKVPAGFDPKPLQEIGVADRYELGANVTSAVTCSWIKEWEKAKAAGDTAGIKTAVSAMAGSRSWKVLLEMQKTGAFASSIWETADAMAKDKLHPELRLNVCH
jgi:hypothetical protein